MQYGKKGTGIYIAEKAGKVYNEPGKGGALMESVGEISFLIKKIHDDIIEIGNRVLREQNLTVSQLYVLEFLRRRDGLETSVGDLCENMGVSHATAIGLIRRLVQKGMCTVSTGETDKRVRHISLVRKENCLPDALIEKRSDVQAELLKGFTDGEAEMFVSMLHRINDNLSTNRSRMQDEGEKAVCAASEDRGAAG